MDRRRFLQGVAATGTALALPSVAITRNEPILLQRLWIFCDEPLRLHEYARDVTLDSCIMQLPDGAGHPAVLVKGDPPNKLRVTRNLMFIADRNDSMRWALKHGPSCNQVAVASLINQAYRKRGQLCAT